MQIRTKSILLLTILFLAETTAFVTRHFLENGISSDSPGESSISKGRRIYFRDLANRLERTIGEIKSSSSKDVVVPQKSTGDNEKRGNTVQTGKGQTSQIFKAPGDTGKRGNTIQIGQGQTSQILQAPVPEPNEVGFHVTLSEKKYVGPRDVILPFDNIRESVPEQVNGYYDPKTGFFTSPITGTYLVSLTIANDQKNIILANVMVNGSERKISVVSDGRSGISQSSVTGIVKLRAKDTLNVGIDEPMYADVYGDNLSSWSVYLLKKY